MCQARTGVGDLERQMRRRRLAAGIFALAVFVAPFLAAGDQFYLVMDPYFYRSPLTIPVNGTKETVFAFYRAGDAETLIPAKAREMTTEEQAAAERRTESHARRILASIEPEIIRNTHGVITALRIRSPDPTLSGLLLLPDIGNHYANLLGPDCYFAVPNRQTILFFPRLASDIQSFSPLVHSLYHNDPWPVSTEIFEMADGKLRAKGRFTEDF